MKKPSFSMERASLEITTRDKFTCTLAKKALISNHWICHLTPEEMEEVTKPQLKHLHKLINTTVCAVRAQSQRYLFNNTKGNEDIVYVTVYALYGKQEKTLTSFHLKPKNGYIELNTLTARIVRLIRSHLVKSMNNILDAMH